MAGRDLNYDHINLRFMLCRESYGMSYLQSHGQLRKFVSDHSSNPNCNIQLSVGMEQNLVTWCREPGVR